MKISLHSIGRMNALLRGIKVKGASWMENQPLICFLTGFSCLGLPMEEATLALPTPKNIRSNDPVLLTRARSEVLMDSYPSTASSLLSEPAPTGIWRPLNAGAWAWAFGNCGDHAQAMGELETWHSAFLGLKSITDTLNKLSSNGVTKKITKTLWG